MVKDAWLGTQVSRLARDVGRWTVRSRGRLRFTKGGVMNNKGIATNVTRALLVARSY